MLNVAVELVALLGHGAGDGDSWERPYMDTAWALFVSGYGVTGHAFLSSLRVFLKALEG